LNAIPASFPDDAVFIAGAGRFGRRAAEVLTSSLKSPIWLIDQDEKAFCGTERLPISRITMDAALFLQDHFPSLTPDQTIVPSVPLHLAFEWLVGYVGKAIARAEVPQEIRRLLPNSWTGARGSLLVSYADFVCPEECPEPADRCTVTRKERGTPLYETVSGIELSGYRVHVLRSRQMAPGVGGYKVKALSEVLEDLSLHPGGKWILGTACRCHGILTAFRSLAGEGERFS
jgi:hypothetical protein